MMRGMKLATAMAPLAVVLGLGACGPKSDNVGTDGSYGFDGDGWTRTTTPANQDRWVSNGGLTLFIRGPAVAKPSASTPAAWAQAEYTGLTSPPTGAPSLFAPKAFAGKGTAFWFGWVYAGQNVYEYYFIDDGSKKALQAEISGVALSESAAAGVLATITLL